MNQLAANVSLNENDVLPVKSGTDPNSGQPVTTLSYKPLTGGKNGHRHEEQAHTYASEPLWVNLLYAIGTLIAITVPLLIKGISARGLMMGYIGGIVGFYLIVSIWGIARNVRPSKAVSRVRR